MSVSFLSTEMIDELEKVLGLKVCHSKGQQPSIMRKGAIGIGLRSLPIFILRSLERCQDLKTNFVSLLIMLMIPTKKTMFDFALRIQHNCLEQERIEILLVCTNKKM